MSITYIIIIGTIVFFVPTILSLILRRVSFGQAFTLNIALGFTWVGWLSTIAWCVSGDDSRIKKKINTYSPWLRIVILLSIVLIEIAIVYIIAKQKE